MRAARDTTSATALDLPLCLVAPHGLSNGLPTCSSKQTNVCTASCDTFQLFVHPSAHHC